MIDINCLYTKHKNLASPFLLPMSAEDEESLNNEYKFNQPVRCKITKLSTVALPSIIQLNTLHACFQLVADNSDVPQLRTKENVKLSCKIGIDYRDPTMCFVRPDGNVQFSYLSFSTKKLKGRKREQVIQQAFEWCAETLGMEVEEMVAIAKSKMRRYQR